MKSALFAYGFGPISQQTTVNYLATFDCVITEFNIANSVSAIKQQNPNAFIIGYLDSIMMGNVFNAPDWATVNAHEDWFQHDINGNRMENKTYRNEYLLDFGNTALQAYLANWVASKCAQYGFDGVFLDDVWDSYNANWVVPTTNTTSPVAPSVPANWQANMRSFISAIKTALPSKKAIINTSPMPASFPTYIALADGYLDEEFLHPAWYGPTDWYDSYIQPLKRVQILQQYSPTKIVLLNCGVSPLSTSILDIGLYCFVGGLLGNQNNNNVFFSCGGFYDEAPLTAPNWKGHYAYMDTDTGLPLGNFYQDGTLYKRNFEKVQAVIDFTNHVGSILPTPRKVIKHGKAHALGG